MTSKKKFFIVFLLLLFCSFVFVGYQVVNDKLQERKLKEEIQQLAKLDITKDNYKRKMQTTGDFAIVEKAIKDYLVEFSLSTQTMARMLQSEEVMSLLSATNYQQDGPEFLASYEYVQKVKKNFNKEIDKLILACDKEAIMKSISQYNLSDYYVPLYESLMFEDTVQSDLQEGKFSLENTKVQINALFDGSLEVFSFLKANASSWKIEDNQIMFATNELVDQYNILISKIKNPQ